MARFVPTLPQWPCSDCRKPITRHRAYCWVEVSTVTEPFTAIQRKVNGAYCRACASKQAHDHERSTHALSPDQ